MTTNLSRYILYVILAIIAIPSQNVLAGTRKALEKKERYKIAVCDWMILKRQKIGAFQLAKELGCDGLELDMGSLGKRDSFDNKLREVYFQELFKEKWAVICNKTKL